MDIAYIFGNAHLVFMFFAYLVLLLIVLRLVVCGKPYKTQGQRLANVNLFYYPQADSECEHLLAEKFIITAGSPPGFFWTECVSLLY